MQMMDDLLRTVLFVLLLTRDILCLIVSYSGDV